LNDFLHPGQFYCWFSTRFNAMDNGDDSNPLFIYMWLDRAVQQGGVNNPKVKDVRANLMRAASRELRAAGREGELDETIDRISQAPLEMFTPQIWRIDLTAVSGRYKQGVHYPDEYELKGLTATEFEIIID